MIPFADWFPLIVLGSTFTTIGLLKVYGFKHHIVGGGGRPFTCRLLGACPTWSRQLNIAVTAIFLGAGLLFLSILGWLLFNFMLMKY